MHPRARSRLAANVEIWKTTLSGCFEWLCNLDKSNCHFELSDDVLDYLNNVIEPECNQPEFDIVGAFGARYQNYAIAFADIMLVNEAIGTMYEQEIDQSLVSNLVKLVKLVKLVEDISSSNSSNPTKLTNLTNQTKDTVLTVQKRHIVEAWRIIRKCLLNAKALAEYVDMGKELARVREYIKKHSPNPISRTQTIRYTNVTAKQLDEVINTLRERIEIDIVSNETEFKIGNTLMKKGYAMYKWIGEE